MNINSGNEYGKYRRYSETAQPPRWISRVKSSFKDVITDRGSRIWGSMIVLRGISFWEGFKKGVAFRNPMLSVRLSPILTLYRK